MNKLHEVWIDGISYHRRTTIEEEVVDLLNEVHSSLWSEVFYDPTNASVQQFAKPLEIKIKRVKELLEIKKN